MKKNIIGEGEKGGEETGDALEDNGGEKKINVDEAKEMLTKNYVGKQSGEERGREKKECSVEERNESLVNEGEV